MTTTTVTDQIVKLAEQAGLRPHWGETYRGVRELLLNGEGVRSPFGTVRVGARSGRVLRAQIVYGNGGPVRNYAGARQVRAALKSLADGFNPHPPRLIGSLPRPRR